MKKRNILLSIILLFIPGIATVFAQTANIAATPASGGTSLGPIHFEGNPGVATSFNFNGGILPSGWLSSPYTVGKACTTDSPDNSNYFWAMDQAPDGTRYVETNAINVSDGGTITFYIRYGADDPSTGCEDPDLVEEEVILQYSTNNGTSWTTIYDGWDVDGSKSAAWYSWYWNSITIPAGAQTSSTKFRWYQAESSSSSNDNWGLEDVSIGVTVTVTSHSWKIDDVEVSTSGSSLDYTFPATGSYNVYYTYGTNTGSTGDDNTTYLILPVNPTSITATETTICNGSSATLTANNTQGTVYWYTGGCGTTNIGTGNSITVSPNSTTTYYARNYENGQYSASCASVTITVTPLPTYRSKQSGDWTLSSNWEQYNGATWETATSYPGEISNSCGIPLVTIRANHTLTIPPSATISIPNLTIEANGLLEKDHSASLAISEQLIMSEDADGAIKVIQTID